MHITVLGSGGWGTALALLLLKNHHQVTLWSHSPEKAAALRDTRENPSLPGIALPQELQITADAGCVASAGAVVFATPSYALRATARQAAPHLAKGTALVTAAKGVEPESGCRMSQILAQELPGFPAAALSGPSHAEEVAREKPTGCVVACEDPAVAESLQRIFMHPSFRVYTSADIIGVELCGAAKNVIAIGAGMADGLACGDNSKALLMTRALVELGDLIHAAGGRDSTCFGLAGVGDMIVTCTSAHSRNHSAGVLLGQGKSMAEVLASTHSVIEGYYAAQSVTQLARSLGVRMPICDCIYDILYRGCTPADALISLMLRDRKSEFVS